MRELRAPTPAMLTDHYELTMVEAALRSGAGDRRCVFEVFARSLPGRRRYAVVAGLGRLLDALADFRFDDDAIRYLESADVVDAPSREWLAAYRFTGSIDAYPEGEIYFPNSPVLTVEGSFAECVVLETLVLSVLNHDSAVATAAARMVCAAGDRPCIEMGSRRTHEAAAIAAARAAYIGGFASTSNLAAGDRWDIPTTGTAAHAFTLVHDDEIAAFRAQVESLGNDTTLLVDTYDVEQGIRAAVDVAGPKLGAIRLDSGDLPTQARDARRLLDELGAHQTRIVVTSDLDEFAIAALAAAPVDGYGVGTSVVTGSGVPTAGFVYKLVARETADGWRPVEKRSPGKPSRGGRKQAARRLDANGTAVAEVLRIDPAGVGDGERALQVRVVADGEVLGAASLQQARDRCRRSMQELPAAAMKLSPGDPAIDTLWEIDEG
ncbi:MAG TPA: nicotinate phosphoribosyltransferase [Mycobacteriales bacterium]|nr:nicotinate phosphoribosyltransferase [Mycobacteriales bacterium]